MPGNTVYLDAPERTQDLLNIKWSLRSAGYVIGSTWHEGEASTSLLAFRAHWNTRSVGQLQSCDSLVVICGNGDRSMPELAMMAGFALARGMRVFWVGPPVKGLCDFLAIQQFNTANDFEKQIVQQTYSGSIATDAQLAA
jgi:hypothetical protein